MKKNDTIYLLPQYDSNATKEEIQEFFQKKWEYAATLDYVPTSFEELTRIAFRDLKILMKRNDNFYNAVIALSSELVDDIIEDAKDYMEHDRKDCTFLKNVHSLEDFLNSGFYGNYDDSRKYFISVFLDCFYYEVFGM